MESLITILSIITPAIGTGFLVAAIFKHRERLTHLERSEVLEGAVIGIEDDKDDDTKWPYFSVVLPDGATENFKGTVASNSPRFTVGQRVNIYFSAKANPRFIADDKRELWFMVRILYVCGISGLLSPLVLILFKNYIIL